MEVRRRKDQFVWVFFFYVSVFVCLCTWENKSRTKKSNKKQPHQRDTARSLSFSFSFFLPKFILDHLGSMAKIYENFFGDEVKRPCNQSEMEREGGREDK